MRIGANRVNQSCQRLTPKELDQQVSDDLRYFLANLEHWVYNHNLNVLHHHQHGYEIDFDQIKNLSDVGHWVMHLHAKRWMDGEALLEFIDFVSIYKLGDRYDPSNIAQYT